ncbi:MAG: ribonuclease H family protein [Bacillaceae bacterium]|nr:ribonuclease H [Bacillaceae bacterium]
MGEKYYVVWHGKKKGVFSNWKECEAQVKGVPGAKYKSFPSKEEAEAAFRRGWEAYLGEGAGKGETEGKNLPSHADKIEESITVDASCTGNPGPMEYRGVYTKTGQILFHYGPVFGTNNIGEFLAIVHALSYLKKNNLPYPVYSDSENAILWVKRKKANPSLPKTKETEKVWDLIHRAEKWLRENDWENEILKWRTEEWGENIADFGRK